MKAIVLGAGRMGAAAAYDLARQPDVTGVVVVDRDAARAEACAREIGSKVASAACDLRDSDAVRRLFETARVSGSRAALGVFSAASYTLNLELTRAAIATGAHFVDLGGNNAVVRSQLGLDSAAKSARVTVIPDCGLAPGMAGWLAARLARRLDRCERIAIRVGGLPADRDLPLGYRLVFSVEGLINEYKERCLVVRGGVRLEVDALSEVETLEFPPPFSRLEAFHTSGGLSTLPETLDGVARDMDYKTIRYPGHAEKIRLLFELGLAGEAPIDAGGIRVAPRKVLEACLEKALTGEVDDVALVRVDATGTKDGRRTTLRNQIIDRADHAAGHSAMARTTSFPASIALLQAMRGEALGIGVIPGEVALDLDRFVAEVFTRGIVIEETNQPVN